MQLYKIKMITYLAYLCFEPHTPGKCGHFAVIKSGLQIFLVLGVEESMLSYFQPTLFLESLASQVVTFSNSQSVTDVFATYL